MDGIVVIRGALSRILSLLFSEDKADAFSKQEPLDDQSERSFREVLDADFGRMVSFVNSMDEVDEIRAAWMGIPNGGVSYLQGNMDASNMVELAPQYRREWFCALLAGDQLAIQDLRRNMFSIGLSYLADEGGIKSPGALSLLCRKDVPRVWMICHVKNPQASMRDRIATLMLPEALLPLSIKAEALEKGCHIHQMPSMSEGFLRRLTHSPEVTKTVSLLSTQENALRPRSLTVLEYCLNPTHDRSLFSMCDKRTGYSYVDFQALHKELTALAQEVVPDAWRDGDLGILQGLAQGINPEVIASFQYMVTDHSPEGLQKLRASMASLKQMLTDISSGSVQDLKQRIAALPQRSLDDLIIFLYRAGQCTLARKCLPCAPYVDAHSMHQQALARLRDPSIRLQSAIEQLAASISCLKEDSETKVRLQEFCDCCRTILNPQSSAVGCDRALLTLNTQHCLWISMIREDIIPEIECSEAAVSAAVSHALINSVPSCELEATLTMSEDFESRRRKALQSLLRVSLEVPQERIRYCLGNLLTLLKPCLPWVLVLDRDGSPQITWHPDSLLQLVVMDRTTLIGLWDVRETLRHLQEYLGQLVRPGLTFTITEQFIADCQRILDPNATEEVLQQASQRLSEQYHRCLSDMRDEITGLSQAQYTLELARLNLFLAESNLSIVEFTLGVLVKEEINLERELQERFEGAKNQYELVNKNREELASRVRILKDGLHELARQKPAPVLARAAAADLNGSTLKVDLSDKGIKHGSRLEVAAARIGETKAAPSGEQIRQKHIEQLNELGELEAQTLQLDAEWQHLNRQLRLIQESLKAQAEKVNAQGFKESVYQLGDPSKREFATRAKDQLEELDSQVKTIHESMALMSAEQVAVFYTKISESPQQGLDAAANPIAVAANKLSRMSNILKAYLKADGGKLRAELNRLRDARLAAATEDAAGAAAASVTAEAVSQFIEEQLPEYPAAQAYVEDLQQEAGKPRLAIARAALERARTENAAAEAAVQALQAKIEGNANPAWLECRRVIEALLIELKRILPWVRTNEGVVLCEQRSLCRVRSHGSFHALAAANLGAGASVAAVRGGDAAAARPRAGSQ